MEPTQEQLDSYAEALCQLKEIKDFLNSIKCNPDGSYSQINENCCFNSKHLNIEDIIKLISVQLNQEILDRLDNLNNIDIELDEAEMQRLAEAMECICQKLTDINTDLNSDIPRIEEDLNNINTILPSIGNNLNDIETNTTPLADILPILDDIITYLQQPEVVDIIPVTELYSDDINGFDGGGIYFYTIPEYQDAVDYTAPLSTPVKMFAENIGKIFDSNVPGATELGQYAFIRQTPPLRTGVGRCEQELIKVYSDGTYTDLNNAPVTINDTTERKVGWCRTGLITTAWNTPYVNIT